MTMEVTALRSRRIHATDGEVGELRDVLVEDEHWAVRYLIVRTGGWFDARDVLLSPASLSRDVFPGHRLQLTLTREQIRAAPAAETELPVSRHYERLFAAHYGTPAYWEGPLLWGGGLYPIATTALADAVPTPHDEIEHEIAEAERDAAEHSHLRSAGELLGYAVAARDADAGRLDDIVLEADAWRVRALVVDTKPWWPGGRVLVAPEAVEAIDWAGHRLTLALTREEVRRSRPA